MDSREFATTGTNTWLLPPRGAGTAGRAYVLALGFGSAVAAWAVGYICRMPSARVPSGILLVLLLVCFLGGGWIAGRRTGDGLGAGLRVGVVASLINLLVLAGLLGGDRPNTVVPSALIWIPGSILAGGVLGAIGAAVGSGRAATRVPPTNWTGAFAKVAATATFFLLIVGGIVTGHEAGLAVVDWPNSYGYAMFLYPLSSMSGGIYYEHAHRLFGTLVGLTTLVLAVHLQIADSRRWLKRCAWAALIVVVVQGILGGLRVTGRFTMSDLPGATEPNLGLAVVHGVVGQSFFAIMVAIATFTSTAWRARAVAATVGASSAGRPLSAVLVLLLIVQIVVGAIQRHLAQGLLVHITLGSFVAIVAGVVGAQAWARWRATRVLRRMGPSLGVLAAAQMLLGVAALLVTTLTADVTPRPVVDVVATTIHQAAGAALLAVAVVVGVWTYRKSV
jgi:cytochrome c oxidase assembly protein subunit 15